MKNNRVPKKIAVLGVGLIGGSIALGLKKQLGNNIHITGLCRTPQKSKDVLKNGLVDSVFDLTKPVPGSVEILIIAVPVTTILALMKVLYKKVSGKTLIIDVGSTKTEICRLAGKIYGSKIRFIGTHPMAGSELSGYEHAGSNLFLNKPWIICPLKTTDRDSLDTVEALINLLGARPIIMTPGSHDRLVALASHLFLAVSSLLMTSVCGNNQWRKAAPLASTGLRDTTRLASGNPYIKTDIFLTNRKPLLDVLTGLKKEINLFSSYLKLGKRDKIESYLKKAKTERDLWLDRYFN